MPKYVIRCDEEGNTDFLDALYPEYSIEWDEQDGLWKYSWRQNSYKKWNPDELLHKNEEVYRLLIKYFGLEDFLDQLSIEKVSTMSPSELEKISIALKKGDARR